MRISAPLKGAYAEANKLDIEQLMSSGVYKEKYRLDMIKWSDEIRQKDPGYFCKLADKISKIELHNLIRFSVCSYLLLLDAKTPITLVSDIRRKTDLVFFENNFARITKRVRIIADLQVREKRGYSFTLGNLVKCFNFCIIIGFIFVL